MTYGIKAIDHIQLAAPRGCEAEARKFYGDVLGFKEIGKPATLAARGGAWFQAGSVNVHIGVEEPFSPARKAHPAFEVSGIEEMKSYLAQNGVKVIEDGDLPGANRFYAHDPFGNRLEFLEWL